MLILLTLLLFPLAQGITQYQGKTESACFFNHSTLYFNFAVADYNPKSPLDIQAQLIIIQNENLCGSVGDFGKEVIKNKQGKVAMMVPRGNCTFVQKTRNAQYLGVDLLIVHNTREYEGMVSMGGSSSKPIFINSILISALDAANIQSQYKTCYLSTIKIGNTTDIDKPNNKPSSIRLPHVFFDLNDIREMEYLSEFYRNDLYQAFISKMQISHKILFTNDNCSKNECVFEKDCILSTPISGDNYVCYKPPTYQHSGKRIIKQQARSLAILQVLGSKTWFVYRQLFYHNMCHYDEVIQNCINKTLKEMGISESKLAKIETKIEQIQSPAYLKKALQNGSLVKVQGDYESAYVSQVPSLFIRLCQTMNDPPSQCVIFKEQAQQIKVADNKAAYYDFKYTASKTLFIQIDHKIIQSLEELTIILTSQPNTFRTLINIDLNTLETSSPTPIIQGRFGFQSNITESNIEIASKIDNLRNNYLIMKKEQIVYNNFTLVLNLDRNESYRLMVWAEPKKYILRSNEEITTIIDNSKSKNFILEYTYFYNEQQPQFLLTFESKLGYYYYERLKLFRYENESIGDTNLLQTYLSSSILRRYNDEEQTYYMHSKSKELNSLKTLLGNCQSQPIPLVQCRFVLNVANTNSLGTLFKISLIKVEPKSIKPLNSVLQTIISPEQSYVQRIHLDSQSLAFGLNDFQIIATTNYSSQFKHQYRLLKHNSKQFATLQQWERQYLSRTELLYNWQYTNKVNYTKSTMTMKHPYNAIKEHLRITNITIFLVYKISPSLSEYLPIVQSLKLTKPPVHSATFIPNYFSQYLTNQRFTSSTPYSFAADEGVSRKIKSNVLLQVPIKNENIRVFMRIYTFVSTDLVKSGSVTKSVMSSRVYKFMTPKYFDNFTHYIYGYNDSQRHQHPKYFQLVQHPYISMRKMLPQIINIYYRHSDSANLNAFKYITAFEAYVEMIDRSVPIQATVIYLFGNTISDMYFDPNKNLSNSQASLTLSNPSVSYNNYFKVDSKKLIRILNVQSVVPQLTDKIQICTYKQLTYLMKDQLIECFNYSDHSRKYWKDLQTGKIYSGLKLVQSAGRVKMQIPQQNTTSSLTNQTHSVYQLYQNNIDFYIKIRFNDFNKMVQVYSPSNDTYQMQPLGNDQQIISQYRNSTLSNNTKEQKDQQFNKQEGKGDDKETKGDSKESRPKQPQKQSSKNETNQKLDKLIAQYDKKSKELDDLKALTLKEYQTIKQQKQQLLKDKADLQRQKQEIVKQKAELQKQKQQMLKQKQQIRKQKQASNQLNQDAIKLKEEATKMKEQANKTQQQMQKQKTQLSNSKLQLAKQQQKLSQQLQHYQQQQLSLQKQKDNLTRQREELKKRQQLLGEVKKNDEAQPRNNTQTIESFKPTPNSKPLTVDSPQNKATQGDEQEQVGDSSFLYKIIGLLMVLILFLFCCVILTLRRLQKVLDKKVKQAGEGNRGNEEQSENKICKIQPY